MALSNEDLEQILEAVSQEGFRFQLMTELFETVQDVVLERGEVIVLEDLAQLRFADGLHAVAELPSISIDPPKVEPTALASVIATSMWSDKQKELRKGSLGLVLVPLDILTEFVAQKPDNFSLLQGEPLSDLSPFRQFWETAPDMQGSFLRNYDPEGKRDPEGKTRKLGDLQEGALEQHFHRLGFALNVHEGRLLYDGSYSRMASNTGSQPSTTGVLGAKASSETRPVNHCVLYIWKTYDV